MIDNDDCIYIEDWMVKKLNLKGNELITFALIYDSSQDEIINTM